jgi:hypothetical protein
MRRKAMGACKAVFFLCVMAASSIAHAQGIATSFSELRLLVRPGDALTITSTAGLEVTGRLVDVSSGRLVLRVGKGRQEWREDDVSRIRQRRGDSLGNGALWGFIGGLASAGTLVAIAVADCSDCDNSGAWVAFPVYGAMGVGVGVGIDALIIRRHVIFQRSGSVKLHLVPILQHSRRGVEMSVGF